jgi:hypothetical protein
LDVAYTGQKLQADAKRVLEVSLVRQGAHKACFVTTFEEEGHRTLFRKAGEAAVECPHADPWSMFDLP